MSPLSPSALPPDFNPSPLASDLSAASSGKSSAKYKKGLNTADILDAVQEGHALTTVEALHLLGMTRDEELAALQLTADGVRQRQVGNAVSYRNARALYLTNYCEMAPALYDYPRLPGDAGGFVLSIDDIDAALECAKNQGASQFYLSGGGFWSALSIPGLEAPTTLKTYARVLSHVRDHAPRLEITGFSPDEIEFLSIVSDREVDYVLELLQDLGLRLLGGAGAEILVDSVRHKISPKKATVKRWFEIVSVARTLNLPVQATLEAGPLESAAQRVAHLQHLKTYLQADLEQSGWRFEGLIPQMWKRLPAKLIDPKSPRPQVSAEDRLKLTAVTRLMLGECLPHQQVCWLPNGATEAQEALQWGANGLGGTHALAYGSFLAGGGSGQTAQEFSAPDFHQLISETGRKAVLAGAAPADALR